MKELSDKALRNILLWAKESYFRALLVFLLITIVGVPTIEFLQSCVKNIPYVTFFKNAYIAYQNTFDFSENIILSTVLILGFIVVYILIKLIKQDVIKDSFEEGLSKWNIPLNARWVIDKCDDALGKMLKISNSEHPGLLKEAMSWYDYEISFQAKLGHGSTSFPLQIAIRSENYLNGLIVMVTREIFQPIFLTEGILVEDDENSETLPYLIPTDTWATFKFIVKGNDLEVHILDNKLHYKIPTEKYTISEQDMPLFEKSIKISEVKKSQGEVKKIYNKGQSLYDNYSKEKDPNKKSEKQTEWINHIKNYPKTTTIKLEFQKGSIGFLNNASNSSKIRKLIVKKIRS